MQPTLQQPNSPHPLKHKCQINEVLTPRRGVSNIICVFLSLFSPVSILLKVILAMEDSSQGLTVIFEIPGKGFHL